MRPRQEIETDMKQVADASGGIQNSMLLEVLLDIRDITQPN